MIIKFIILRLRDINISKLSNLFIEQNQIIKRYKIRKLQLKLNSNIKSTLSKIAQTNKKMEKSQYRQLQQISRFLSNYSIQMLNKKQYTSEDAIIISNQSQSQNNYLIKHIPINQQQCDLQNIIQTLSQHRDFDSKYILTLLDFQIVEQAQNRQECRFVRTIYQYGRKSLEEEIQIRKITQLYFQQDELWVLLSSLVNPLAYLQSKRVIYGVLAMNKIFVDPKIKLLDPSCTGIDPYQITAQRLYSPQLLNNNQNLTESSYSVNQKVDMFKSDVFVMGLIILQSGLLTNFNRLKEGQQFDLSEIQEYINEFQQRYSQNLSEMVKRMLNFIPEHRPNFQQVLDQINKMFEFSSCQIQIINPLEKDKQDQPNQMQLLEEGLQEQVNDYLEDCYKQTQILTQFQKAKLKFLGDSNYSHSRNVSVSQEDSFQQKSNEKQKNTTNNNLKNSKQTFQVNDKRKNKARQIKDKLVKPYTCHPNQVVTEYPQFQSIYEKYQMQSDAQSFIETERITNKKEQQNKQKRKSRSKTMITTPQLDQNYYSGQNYGNFFNGQSSLNSYNLNTFNRSRQIQDKNSSLFTDPQLMKLIKSDLKKIQQKRSAVMMNGKLISQNKENIHKNNQQSYRNFNSNEKHDIKKQIQKNSQKTSHNTSLQYRFQQSRNENPKGIHYQQLFRNQTVFMRQKN